MSGAAFITVSPSSSMTTRSTPWVEGCCGPMFRTMCRPWPSPTGAASAAGTDATRSSSAFMVLLVLIRVLIPVDRVVLAQRVTVPVVGHQDAARIGMIPELDAEHVEGLPLVPIGGPPHAGDGIDLGVVARQPALHSK